MLRFFEAEVVPNVKHQLIYSTHSPFMVDSTRFDRVRIVQDKSIDLSRTYSMEFVAAARHELPVAVAAGR